ncbi:MAG: Nramp family divalent metal transporter [Planctomycetota bacterium]
MDTSANERVTEDGDWQPTSCLPAWGREDLPEPPVFSWRQIARLIGPGIVMMGIQIGGGEWLFGPELTARYGGGLMWIATIAILLQVFYNIECGRYALFCGEPVLTGFMRLTPGPKFWFALILLLNASALIPGLSTHGAALIASLMLNRPPGEEDRLLVTRLAYLCLIGTVMPVLIGGKVYNMLQAVMTAKVLMVLGFCLFIGLSLVSYENWLNVFTGFLKFGHVPVEGPNGKEMVVNLFSEYWQTGSWPAIAMANIAVLGAFAGYAGGGGLSNSTYSNFVRDKGWGMGKLVGAIPSAVGGKNVELSHHGKTFPINSDNLSRWRGWWKVILRDQVFIWAPGCFMGMALPALMSIQFAQYSDLPQAGAKAKIAQALITADGLRQAPNLSATTAQLLWIIAVLTGMSVMLPGQMSIVDDFSRRWTDAIWSSSKTVQRTMKSHQVSRIYYCILALYVFWSLICAYLFTNYGTPKLMTIVIANLNNLAIGITAFVVIYMNHRLLPQPLRPRWYQTLGMIGCGIFYLGLSALVFFHDQLPFLIKTWQSLMGRADALGG